MAEINPSSKSILDEVMQAQDESYLHDFNPQETVSAILKLLGRRESEVLARRYSLSGQPAHTLEEIGKAYQITRERVRQIEAAALRTLQDSKQVKKQLDAAVKAISAVMENHGKVMEEQHLLDELLQNRENSDLNRHSALFIMEVADDFTAHRETPELKKIWALTGGDVERAKKIIEMVIEHFSGHGEPVHADKVYEHFSRHPSYAEHRDILSDAVLKALLSISKKVSQNPFQEWGLAHWENIRPRGVRDKAYMVIKKHGKPIHFTQIAELINRTRFDSKRAHPQTVHNELIKDRRFVLVGRGLYALKEWGFEPGTVADMIEKVLREAGHPLKKSEIVGAVGKTRMVKNNTIILGLQDKKRFRKFEDGRYGLVA